MHRVDESSSHGRSARPGTDLPIGSRPGARLDPASPWRLAGLLVGYMLQACVLTAACVCLGIAAAAWACSEPWTAVAIGAVVLVACVLAGVVAERGKGMGVVEDDGGDGCN